MRSIRGKQARRVILMAFGENKAGAVAAAVEGPVSAQCAASYLQQHPDAQLMVDYAAAAGGWDGVGGQAGLRAHPASKAACLEGRMTQPCCCRASCGGAAMRMPTPAAPRHRLPASAGLTRSRCPWVLGPIQWDDTQVRQLAAYRCLWA